MIVYLFIGLALIFTSCQSVRHDLEPIIIYTPPENRISDLPSAFKPITEAEKKEEWSKELLMGDAFAAEWDLYRAITCYKRALLLLPDGATERRLQIEYDLILCYYLGHKYQEAINVFESSELIQINAQFPASNNLLILLYDCYLQLKMDEKACKILEIIEKLSPETASDLTLYTDMIEGDIVQAQSDVCGRADFELIQPDFDSYYVNAKSIQKARTLNAILPGAGYYYVGQHKAALTSFIINTLFTAAAYQFFRNGYVAAGLFTTSLEAGWYLGGINGAGLAAKEYNNRLYEAMSKKVLVEQNCFPVLIFETSF